MTLTATCHCGATHIEVPAMPKAMKSCNCTFCHRTGAVWGYYDPADLKVVSAEHDAVYAPNGMNHHHFCSKCGGNTHGSSPDWASMYNADGTSKEGVTPGVPERRIAAINMRMIIGLDLDTLAIEKMDGRSNW
jgi:hypothetical protein